MTTSTTDKQRSIQGALLVGGVALAGAAVWRLRQEAMRANYAKLPPTRVVVLGIGFAGLAAATELAKVRQAGASLDITVVDRHNFHLFTPLLYQVATGSVEVGYLTFPARAIARDRGFDFQERTVRDIDFNRRLVTFDDGALEYDYLILALGSVSNFFGMVDVAQNALPLKSTGDSLAIHNRIIDRFEEAAIESNRERRQQLLTFIVAGGGATGVELVAALHELIHDALLSQYPMIDPSEIRLILVEARDEILAGWDPRISRFAHQWLCNAGIEVWTNTAVARAWPGGVETRDGRLVSAGTVVWTAGIRPVPLAEALPVERARDGRIVVDADLRVRGQARVFAVGDLAYHVDPSTGRPQPPNAPAAISEGQAAAQNCVRLLGGQSTKPFSWKSKGDLISLGRLSAVADLFGVVFDGFPGWVTRRTVYLLNLVGFKSRLAVAVDWAFALAGRQNTARIEVQPTHAAVEQHQRVS